MAAYNIDGKAIAITLQEKLTNQVKTLPGKPGLAVILVGNDPASQIYVNNKEKACQKIGYYSEKIVLPETITAKKLYAVIDRLNQDDHIHGILCQFPLPPSLSSIEQEVIKRINPVKDVDGFHPLSPHTPCTPKGIMELIHQTNVTLAGKYAVVIGRSHMVGKPIAQLLLNEDATVTITHSKTVDLPSITKQADILVVAIGKPNFITREMVKPNAIIIDVGINRTASGLIGDVDFEQVKEIASYITPVPGGVGPMTIAMLMQNVYNAYQMLTTEQDKQ